MKSLNEHCDRIISFPPGHYYTSVSHKHVEYYHPSWFNHVKDLIPKVEHDLITQTQMLDDLMYKNIRETLEKSVKKRLMSEVPYGVLLSGGLDSSLIAAIAMRARKQKIDDEDSNCILMI